MDKNERNKLLTITAACLVFICIFLVAFFVLKMLITDDGSKRKRQIQQVTLMKPPPPPKIKEKPPEPEMEKKEEMIEPELQEQPPDQVKEAATDDAPPAGEELGLDSDGTGGADGFGLKAKKGGRSLIGGNGGDSSLLRQYAWYTRILQDEIREKVDQYLEKKKDLPAGKHKLLVRVQLDETGNMVLFSILESSGISNVDDAIEQAVAGFRISETPPEGMPKSLKVKVTFKS